MSNKQANPKELQDLYKRVFNSDDGKLVIGDLQKRFWMMQPTYCVGDTHETAYREGQRSIVLALMGLLREDNREYPTETEKE